MIGRPNVKIRVCRKLPLWRGEVRAVLMSAIHGRVPGHVPLDQLSLIGLGQHLGENIFQVSSSLNRRFSFHRLLLTEALGRLSSANPDPISLDYPLDDAVMNLNRTPALRRSTGHHRRAQRPLRIR